MSFLMVCLVGLLVSVDASPVSSPMIEGQVRLSNGSPVVGAQVVLFDLADLRRGLVGQAITDEAGQFALPLAAGGGWVMPSEVGLGPNYPNPFNPSTLIPYQLAATSPVRLEVFNILGQRVATLVDGQQEAGAYVARWDGTDAVGRAAASGVYFYRLTVAGAHWTGKMVLVDGQAGVPLGGGSVAAVPLAAGSGSSATYGLVVSGEGLVTYADSDFVVEAGQGPVELEVAAEPNGRGKVVASLEGMLGDVDNNGRVDMDDGLLVAMLSVDPALLLPHHGVMTLGDVNCDGRVELDDAGLLAAYVANPSDPEVSSLWMGQPGGYSLGPVTEVVWGSILGTEQSDATVARLLDGVPVLLSGVLSVGIDGEDRVYLGIDRAYWTQQVTSTHEAPTVTSTTTYYYYVCVDTVTNETQTDNNCSTPARITVQPKPEEVVVDLSALPMGGDALIGSTHDGSLAGGTVILGGLETTTGVPGFVTSAHVVAPENPDRTRDFTAGLNTLARDRFGDLLGKVFRIPTLQRVETDTGEHNLLPADAAFVAYPHPKTPGCSLTFTDTSNTEFCLDVGAGEYLERIQPLKVRGEGDATYTVVGSREPTRTMEIWFSGSRSGIEKGGTLDSLGRLLTSVNNYKIFLYGADNLRSIGGNSGSPVYTAPDTSGNIHVLGVLEGGYSTGGTKYGITFSSWDDVEEALDLKPISAPDSPAEEDEEDEEDEEELADLFAAFD